MFLQEVPEGLLRHPGPPSFQHLLPLTCSFPSPNVHICNPDIKREVPWEGLEGVKKLLVAGEAQDTSSPATEDRVIVRVTPRLNWPDLALQAPIAGQEPRH